MAFSFRQMDAGPVLELRLESDAFPVNVSSATTKELVLVDPKGRSNVRPAEFVTDGSDGLLQYRLTSGDLYAPGPWRVFAHVNFTENGETFDLYSAAVRMDVEQTFGRNG